MFKKSLGYFVVAGLVLAGYFTAAAPRAFAAAAPWRVKGVSIVPRSPTDFSSGEFQNAVRQAKADGVNNITLIIPYYQDNTGSTTINAGANTPNDQPMIDAADFVHAQGMQVTFKIHLYSNDGQWSANINPGDRGTWFQNYSAILNHIADIAQRTHAQELVIGNELLSMTESQVNPTNTQNWQDMIAAVRKIYSGRLTYGANWGGDPFFSNEIDHIAFWPNLDDIGISGYFNLSDNLQSSWSSALASEVAPLHAKYNKPIIFTEVGYKSASGAHQHPWMWSDGSGVDLQEQANDYDALMSFWSGVPYFAGVSWWKWESEPGAGGPSNNDYTPQNKPAEQVLQKWFSGSAKPVAVDFGLTQPATAQAVVQQSAKSFVVQTHVGPAVFPPGKAAAIPFSIADNGLNIDQAIIDAEIYDASGNRVFQQFFDRQNLRQNGSWNQSISWTPQTAGQYTLKIGIFGAGWSSNIFWESSAAQINVAEPQPVQLTVKKSLRKVKQVRKRVVKAPTKSVRKR